MHTAAAYSMPSPHPCICVEFASCVFQLSLSARLLARFSSPAAVPSWKARVPQALHQIAATRTNTTKQRAHRTASTIRHLGNQSAMGASNSKLVFASAIKTLLECRNMDQLDDSFWNQFWAFSIPLEEIFNMLSAQDIRALRDDTGQEKLFFLVQKIAHYIEHFFLVTMTRPDNVQNATDSTWKDSFKQVLNCVRLLTRILPFCFEDPQLADKISRLLCIPSTEDGDNEQRPWKGFTIAMIDLLFIPGLTLPIQFIERSKIFYIVWEDGIGSEHPIESYQEIQLNRHDILRLILVMMSYQMYLPAKGQPSSMNPFAFILTTTLPEPVTLALLCSLLNMVVKYDPIGWGLPYNYYLFPDEDESVFCNTVQLLNTLIDFDPHRFTSLPETDQSPHHWIIRATGDINGHDVNIFRYYISKLYRKEDFFMLWTGLMRHTLNPIQANKTYLPGSSSQIRVFSEVLALFWRVIQVNPAYFKYVLERESDNANFSLTDLVSALGHYATDQEFNLSSDGLVHLCCFILLQLSGEREFSVRLNHPYQTSFSSSHFDGTFADYLIHCFLQIINKSRQRFYTVGECIMMTLVNMSPFIRSLSSTTCIKLVGFMERCTQPALIYSSPMTTNPFVKICTLLGEAFGYILQYQYDTNAQFVYTLLRKRQFISSFNEFTFLDYQQSILQTKKQNVIPINEEQFDQIQQEIHNVMKLLLDVLGVLGPEVSKLCPADENDACDEQVILSYLQRRTLVGLIPLPKPISIRKFRMSNEIASWLTSFLYGVIYLHNSYPSIWYGTNVKLFTVKTATSSMDQVSSE